MNFQKEKEEDFDVPPFAEDFLLLFFFDDPPPCDPANRCMLDVFDFFATIFVFRLRLRLKLLILGFSIGHWHYH